MPGAQGSGQRPEGPASGLAANAIWGFSHVEPEARISTGNPPARVPWRYPTKGTVYPLLWGRRFLFSLHWFDFHAEDRSHHGGKWNSPVGKPHGKDSRESHRFLDPREGKRDTAATSREESARACPHSRQGLTPLGRLQKYPKIHVSTGEESSGSGTDSTQGLKHRHRQERNPKRPPSNSHGDWPFLKPPVGSLRSPS